MIERPRCDVWNAILPLNYNRMMFVDAERGSRPSCRAFRIVGDSMKFLFLKVPEQYDDDALGRALTSIIEEGFKIKFKLGYGTELYLHFGFLGFTEKTIKSGHIILLQRTVINSGDTVPSPAELLEEFGNLQDVYTKYGPGKYAGRLGLSFSATVDSVNPASSELARIPDCSAMNGVLTTDGCGIIRETYSKEIRSRHNFDSRTSVFQIRRGGIKGLLVAYPDEQFDGVCRENGYRTPSRYKFAFRPSMLKYDGGPTRIEINGVSEPPRSARLNVSIIVILMSIGAPFGGFGDVLRGLKELLKLQLRSIDMIAYDRQEALSYIEGDLDADGDSFHQELYEMLQAGHPMGDASIRKKLRYCQQIQYDNLREKLSIRVQKSCSVYGVVDELGVLGQNEVFVQLPHREGILVADVLIARHPSYKETDVRLLKAVDKPELYFLTNCIVFPRWGNFSIPGTMSGGDLDGDKFFVCWEPTIFPPTSAWPGQSNSQPDSPQIDWNRRPLNESLVDLFVEQHHSNLVGYASKEWQSVVEKYPLLAGADYPEQLAYIIEEALDILKSGGSYSGLMARYVDLVAEYKVESRSIKRQKSKLHSLRNMIPSIKEDKEDRYIHDPDLDLQAQRPDEWKRHYEEGKCIIRQFNRGLAEAIAKDTVYRNVDGSDENRRRRRKEDDTKYAVEYIARFRDKYFPRSPGILSESNLTSYVRASAWYYVGYEEEKPVFAWLGVRFLNNIKSYETNGGRPGLSIGALKNVQAAESDDADRPLWLYYRRMEEYEPAYLTVRVVRNQLDGHMGKTRFVQIGRFAGYAEMVFD